MQIQISWLLQKPTDLDLHCLQMQDISGDSRTRVKLLGQIVEKPFRSVWVAEWLVFLTLDQKVPGSNPARD